MPVLLVVMGAPVSMSPLIRLSACAEMDSLELTAAKVCLVLPANFINFIFLNILKLIYFGKYVSR